MNNFFDYDGPLFTILNKISDLILLNVLWLLCSIPIVTIGASTTSMYYVAMKLAEGDDGYVTRKFFKAFKENFRQSTIMWLIMLVAGAIIASDVYACLFWEMGSWNSILLPFAFFFALFYSLIFVYLWPLQAKLENKIKYTFKNALLLSIRHLPYSILFIAGTVLSIVLFLKVPQLLPLYLLLTESLLTFGFSFLFLKIFNLYITKKPQEETTEAEYPAASQTDGAFANDIYSVMRANENTSHNDSDDSGDCES